MPRLCLPHDPLPQPCTAAIRICPCFTLRDSVCCFSPPLVNHICPETLQRGLLPLALRHVRAHFWAQHPAIFRKPVNVPDQPNARNQPPGKPPGPRHNLGPAPVSLWHQHMWARARADHPDSRLPLPVVKMRMARAAELGMRYADYAALYRTGGRDPAALLFTPAALHLRLARRLDMPDPVRLHLAGLRGCDLLALAPQSEDPDAFLEELREVSALPFRTAGMMPAPQASWAVLAASLRRALDPLRLTGTAVALVAHDLSEARISQALCTAGRLAGVVDRDAYFGITA